MIDLAGSFMVRLLWPPRCVACHAVTDERLAFCELCAPAALPLGRACRGCALPTSEAGDLCRLCLARPFPFSQARAIFVYGGTVAQAIVRFKHGKHLAPARPLGRCLAPVLGWATAEGPAMIVPVPLHPRRFRSRGFNQARELARAALRAHRQVGGHGPIELGGDVLDRRRDTPALGREGPLARRHRVAGAFAVREPRRIEGRRLLVLDDVMTTGATLAECARTLLEAGAREVRVAALARAV